MDVHRYTCSFGTLFSFAVTVVWILLISEICCSHDIELSWPSRMIACRKVLQKLKYGKLNEDDSFFSVLSGKLIKLEVNKQISACLHQNCHWICLHKDLMVTVARSCVLLTSSVSVDREQFLFSSKLETRKLVGWGERETSVGACVWPWSRCREPQVVCSS